MATVPNWNVVPLSEPQLLDVDPADVLNGGMFRKCDTYKSGGGYDVFPKIAEAFYDIGRDLGLQFVVQLRGCNLDCPYCYVTREGVWGEAQPISSEGLVRAFNDSPCSVFHLMGGAPALRVQHWWHLIRSLERAGKPGWVFHSDLMLTERDYTSDILTSISHRKALYAVNIKGTTEKSFLENTRKKFDAKRFWKNLCQLEKSQVQYYITFTNVDMDERRKFWGEFTYRFGEGAKLMRKTESFSIDLIDYEATEYVDDVPWGGNKMEKTNDE